MDGDGPWKSVSRFYESFDSGDIDEAVAVFSVSLETTDPGMGTVHGLPPFREYLETLKRAMPDARAVIEQMRETYYDQLGLLTQLGLTGDS